MWVCHILGREQPEVKGETTSSRAFFEVRSERVPPPIPTRTNRFSVSHAPRSRSAARNVGVC